MSEDRDDQSSPEHIDYQPGSDRSFIRDREVIRQRLLQYVEEETSEESPVVSQNEIIGFVSRTNLEVPTCIEVLHQLVDRGKLSEENGKYSLPHCSASD